MPVIGDLTELKALGRIDSDAHDALLTSLLDAAESFVEEACCCRFVTTEQTKTDERLDGGGDPNNKPTAQDPTGGRPPPRHGRFASIVACFWPEPFLA